MTIRIVPYEAEHEVAVCAFNARLAEKYLDTRIYSTSFPTSHIPTWLPKKPERDLYQECFVAVDDESMVRGGYLLKHQIFLVNGDSYQLAAFQLPISEGIINRTYPQIGVKLLLDAQRRRPLLYGLGIGGYKVPIARLFEATRWTMFTVPFFFRVIHPGKFLRNVSILRRSAVRRLAFDALAISGLGWLGIHGVQTVCSRKNRSTPKINAELTEDFSDWADEIWNASKDQYGFSAVRDAETLQILYPKGNPRFLRLKVSEGSRTIGWAVTLNTPLANHKQFGNMRLGSIVDGFASTADAPKVVQAAAAFLQSQNVDLIVSNHSHSAWRLGFRQAGFLAGPSNFIFASSPKLTELLRRNRLHDDDLHLNRGDGDGPINL